READAMSGPVFALTGALEALDARQEALLFDRGRAVDSAVARSVARIVAAVREHGDAALREQRARFDGVVGRDLEVPRARWQRALDDLDPGVRDALED